MNEIIRSLIQWTEENGMAPEIYFRSVAGGIWVVVTLRHNKKCISHEFYVAGGVLCVQNWDRFPNEEELNCFIEEAKAGLLNRSNALNR